MEDFEKIILPWSDWKIVKYLGGGTYGRVYEIERTFSGIQEKAALKIVSRPKNEWEIETYYDDGYDKASIAAYYEKEIQNYVQEYRLMKELQEQANIVTCDDIVVVPHENGVGGDIFIRMELLTALPWFLRRISLSEQEIIKLGKDISHALVLCEQKNIIHWDIKPANIMVSQFGNYKLGDFGVSKIMDHTTFATLMGRQEYQAPEVVRMEKYGQAADIYSLGITLYWLLNNRRMPFIEADELPTPIRIDEAMERRYNGEKIPAPKNGSERLKQIVLKACEYRPEDRYTSAQELYDALESLGDDEKELEKIHLPWQDWKIVRDLGGGRNEKVYEIKRCGEKILIPALVNKAALKIISIPKSEYEIKKFSSYDEKSIIAHYEDEIRKYVQKYERIKKLEDFPNIVNCYDVAVVPHENGIGGDIFIQMEFIEKSLRDVVKKGNFSIEEIIELGKDISRALLVCETWEISHCGIRPENIMLSEVGLGNWKLRDYTVGDFGNDPYICVNMERPVYWAPESNFGQAADIYALGIVMYELLNQQSMRFMGMSYMENLPAPKRGSEELKRIVLKACAYKPEDRYASTQELYEALDAVDVPEVPINGGHFSNRVEEAERLLSKIEVEKLTAKNVIRTIIRGIIAWGIGIAVLMAGVSIESGWMIIIGEFVHFGALYWILSRMGAADFSEWMKANKEKIEDIDKYIKKNSEFARRLYYEKCRKKYLLEYMNRLNPDVVKSIKDSKRIRIKDFKRIRMKDEKKEIQTVELKFVNEPSEEQIQEMVRKRNEILKQKGYTFDENGKFYKPEKKD